MELCTEGLSVAPILKQISVAIPKGKLTGIIGPNGAGKTTLLRCLAGELPPQQGSVTLGDNRDLSTWRARERAQHIAYLPQTTVFAFAFTTQELVGLHAASPSSLQGALDTLELTALATRSLLSLSGGERQRVAIARALAQQTPLLLLDEPLTHLDLYYQNRLLAFLKQRSESGATIIVVLHDLKQAQHWCDHLIVLSEGQVHSQGTPKQTLTPESLSTVFRITSDAIR
ncbi:ABC transporter ATP-binding protein [Armatimonas sp.]|uniref:ABC transporter ATP-binding protein n=1 Tax=Armatimonas sp. TaxID=1872638 RepID=UPI00375026F3